MPRGRGRLVPKRREGASLRAAALSPRGPEGRPAARSRRVGHRRRGAARGGAPVRGGASPRPGRGQGQTPRGHRRQILIAPARRSTGAPAVAKLRVAAAANPSRPQLAPAWPAGLDPQARGPLRIPGGVRTLALASLLPCNQRIESAICKVSEGWSSAKPLSVPGFPGNHQKGRGTGPCRRSGAGVTRVTGHPGLWAQIQCASCSSASGHSFPSGFPLQVGFRK